MASSELNRSERKQREAKKQADQIRTILEASFFDMRKANKEAMVSEMLLLFFISNTRKVHEADRDKRAKSTVNRLIRNHGFEPVEEGRKYKDVLNSFTMDDMNYHFYDFDVIFAGDDGLDKIRDLYLDEIKKSDVYKAILSANTKDELTEAMNRAVEEAEKGIYAFESVTLPKAAEELNKQNKKHLNSMFYSLNRSVDSYLVEKEWKDEREVSGFNDHHIEGIIKNAKMINTLYSDIKSLDSENSSKYFKNLLKTFGELKDLADKDSKSGKPLSGNRRGKYKAQLIKVLEKIDDYLENTNNKNQPDIDAQIKKAINLKKSLLGNMQGLVTSADSIRRDVEKMALGEKLKVIDKYNVISFDNRHHFLGDHKLDELEGSSFSLGRSAGYSISVFVLLNRGYNAKDVLDSTKLHKEKQEVFDEVLRRCKSGKEEDNKWLAEQMYNGFKMADKAMDEFYEKVDFGQEDFLQDENYAVLHNLCLVIFDVFQEQSHVSKYMNELAKEDKDYDYEKNPDFSAYRMSRKGVVGMMVESLQKMREPAANIYLDADSEISDYQDLAGGALKLKYLLNILKENQHKISYTELSVKKDREIRQMAEYHLNDIISSYCSTFMNEKASSQLLYEKIFDTSIFNDVKFIPDAKDGIYVRDLPDEEYLVNMAKKYAKTKKNRLHKRQTEYKKASENISNYDDDDAFSEEKEAVAAQLAELNKKLEELSPYNEDGKIKDGEKYIRKLSKDEINTLITLYQKSINKMHRLTTSINGAIDDLQKSVDESNNVFLAKQYLNEIKEYEDLVKQYDHIAKTMSKDLRALQMAAKRTTEVSLDAIFENSRVNSEYMLVGKVQVSNKGNQNERLPLTIADKDGNNFKGYFTKDGKDIANYGHVAKAIRDAKKKYGKKADYLSVDNIVSLNNKFKEKNLEAQRYLLSNPEVLAMKGYEEAVRILCKNMGSGIRSYINTPEKLNIFIDVASAGMKAYNHYGISKGIGINENARVNRRNAALSKLAELLGCGDVIAGAEDIRIKINGKYVKGTFMKEAVGEDINKINKDSKLLKATPLSGMGLELKKQIASLQIIDFLAGNPDRHGGNMLYYFVEGEDGAAYLKTITGIDNDSAFGSNPYETIGMSSVKLSAMKVIPKELSDRIMNLDKAALKQMLYGFDLTTREINNAISRLNMLQEKISREAKEYSKGYTKGYLIPGTIKPVTDEELDEIPFIELKTGSKNRGEINLFDRVANKFYSKNNFVEYDKDTSKNYNKAVYKYTVGSVGEMSKLISALNQDTRFGGSSPKYKEMHSAMKSLNSAFCSFTGPVCGDNIDTSKNHVKALLDIKEKIKETLESVNEYIYYKNYKTSGEEWMLIEGPHEITREERRYKDAIKCREFLSKQLEKFDELDVFRKDYNDVKNSYNELIDNATFNDLKISKNEAYIKSLDTQLDNLYKNHVSRTKYEVKDAFDTLNSVKSYKTYYNMMYEKSLGYGIFGMKPEDRADFRKEIEEFTHKKIELSDEELHKRAFAIDMIITKERCEKYLKDKKNKNPDEVKLNTELLKALKHIETKPYDEAVDKLLNNDTFNEFYNNNKGRFDDFDRYKTPGVSAPDSKKKLDLCEAYNEQLYKKHPELNPNNNVKGLVK